jgi:hypothetical protein
MAGVPLSLPLADSSPQAGSKLPAHWPFSSVRVEDSGSPRHVDALDPDATKSPTSKELDPRPAGVAPKAPGARRTLRASGRGRQKPTTSFVGLTVKPCGEHADRRRGVRVCIQSIAIFADWGEHAAADA